MRLQTWRREDHSPLCHMELQSAYKSKRDAIGETRAARRQEPYNNCKKSCKKKSMSNESANNHSTM